MPGLIDSQENAVLDRLFGLQPLTPPATYYIGALTAEPADDGTGVVEPVGGSYARVAVANNLTQWPAASGGQKANANVILFPTASANWGNITHFGVFDAASGGSLVGYGELDAPRFVMSGDDFRFPVGGLVITG